MFAGESWTELLNCTALVASSGLQCAFPANIPSIVFSPLPHSILSIHVSHTIGPVRITN